MRWRLPAFPAPAARIRITGPDHIVLRPAVSASLSRYRGETCIVPLTLGAGTRLFEGVPQLKLEQVSSLAASPATRELLRGVLSWWTPVWCTEDATVDGRSSTVVDIERYVRCLPDVRRFQRQRSRVVLLSAPLDILLERASRRTNYAYGKTSEQRADIAGYVQTVEPLLRRGATLQLDGQRAISQLADAVERLVTGTC